MPSFELWDILALELGPETLAQEGNDDPVV